MNKDNLIEAYQSKLNQFGISLTFGIRDQHQGTSKQVADSFVKSLGFRQIGKWWFDLDKDLDPYKDKKLSDPSEPLKQVLQRSLAYGGQMFTPYEADKFVQDFYSVFSSGVLARVTNLLNNEWDSITESTFEAVHIAMDDELIAIIIMQEED